MQNGQKNTITISSNIQAPVEKVWELWTNTDHIINWNSASPDWHTPTATHDLTPGGSFSYRMEAKDGSFGFDFGGTFDEVEANKALAYTIGDGRKVRTEFEGKGNETQVTTTFEAESENPEEMQRAGWQAILDSFKRYAETN